MLKILILSLLICQNCFSQITEFEAIDIIKKLESIYVNDPATQILFKKNNRSLNILLMSEDKYVFGEKGLWGNANTAGDILIAGGVLSNNFFTRDTFAALVCHEIGHLVGGLPAWDFNLSYEGQADFYAANVCMRKFYRNYPKELARKEYIHQTYYDECSKHFSDKNKLRECVKISQAGLNLAIASALEVTQTLLPGPGIDEHFVTDETNPERDSAQCIADTFEAGAICNLDPYRKIDFNDKNKKTCNNKPKCWYKAKLH